MEITAEVRPHNLVLYCTVTNTDSQFDCTLAQYVAPSVKTSEVRNSISRRMLMKLILYVYRSVVGYVCNFCITNFKQNYKNNYCFQKVFKHSLCLVPLSDFFHQCEWPTVIKSSDRAF